MYSKVDRFWVACVGLVLAIIYLVNSMGEVKTTFGQPTELEDHASIADFIRNGKNEYGELQNAQLLDTGWYIADSDDNKETEIYIGYTGEKYYLVALDSTKEEDEIQILQEKLLVSKYDITEVENFDYIVDGIAADFTEYMEEKITSDDIIYGMVQIEESKTEGYIRLAAIAIIAIVCILIIIMDIKKFLPQKQVNDVWQK